MNIQAQSTVKKIYVGENDLLRACAATGLSVSEINSLIADGATVSNDGTIQLADKNSTGESTEQETTATSPGESDVTVDQHQKFAVPDCNTCYCLYLYDCCARSVCSKKEVE